MLSKFFFALILCFALYTTLVCAQQTTTTPRLRAGGLTSLEKRDIDAIIKLQKHQTAGATRFFKIMSWLGNGLPYIILAALYYFALSKYVGTHIIGIMLCAIVIQGTIKHAAHKSRPYWVDSGVEAIECHSSTFGFPSGHSMAPTATLGWFAYEMTRRYRAKRSTAPHHWWGVALIWLAVILYSLTVGLSRSYLGVHYLRDTWGGICISIAIVILYAVLVQHAFVPFMHRYGKNFALRLFLALLATAITAGVQLGPYYHIRNKGVPKEWDTIARLQCDDGVQGLSLRFIADSIGLVGGFTTGLVFMRRFVPFNARAPAFRRGGWYKRFIIRPLICLLPFGLLVIPRAIDFDDESGLGAALRIITGWIASFWAAFLGPYICLRISQSHCGRDNRFLSDWIVLRASKEKESKDVEGAATVVNGNGVAMRPTGDSATQPTQV